MREFSIGKFQVFLPFCRIPLGNSGAASRKIRPLLLLLFLAGNRPLSLSPGLHGGLGSGLNDNTRSITQEEEEEEEEENPFCASFHFFPAEFDTVFPCLLVFLPRGIYGSFLYFTHLLITRICQKRQIFNLEKLFSHAALQRGRGTSFQLSLYPFHSHTKRRRRKKTTALLYVRYILFSFIDVKREKGKNVSLHLRKKNEEGPTQAVS